MMAIRPPSYVVFISLLVASITPTSVAALWGSPPPRAERYVDFDPPRITPGDTSQTVKAGQPYTFLCEGGRGGRGVTWRLPVDADDGLRSRVEVKHYSSKVRDSSRKKSVVHSSELKISDTVYTDTGTFVCTYNGTTDLNAVDNSTGVHLYVEDEQHLLKQSGVEFVSRTLVNLHKWILSLTFCVLSLSPVSRNPV